MGSFRLQRIGPFLATLNLRDIASLLFHHWATMQESYTYVLILCLRNVNILFEQFLVLEDPVEPDAEMEL